MRRSSTFDHFGSLRGEASLPSVNEVLSYSLVEDDANAELLESRLEFAGELGWVLVGEEGGTGLDEGDSLGFRVVGGDLLQIESETSQSRSQLQRSIALDGLKDSYGRTPAYSTPVAPPPTIRMFEAEAIRA
jgi:hypothetical protein